MQRDWNIFDTYRKLNFDLILNSSIKSKQLFGVSYLYVQILYIVQLSICENFYLKNRNFCILIKFQTVAANSNINRLLKNLQNLSFHNKIQDQNYEQGCMSIFLFSRQLDTLVYTYHLALWKFSNRENNRNKVFLWFRKYIKAICYLVVHRGYLIRCVIMILKSLLLLTNVCNRIKYFKIIHT